MWAWFDDSLTGAAQLREEECKCVYHGIGQHLAIPRQELGMIEQSIRPTQQFTIVSRARHNTIN
jgi:hypothetical protein